MLNRNDKVWLIKVGCIKILRYIVYCFYIGDIFGDIFEGEEFFLEGNFFYLSFW